MVRPPGMMEEGEENHCFQGEVKKVEAEVTVEGEMYEDVMGFIQNLLAMGQRKRVGAYRGNTVTPDPKGMCPECGASLEKLLILDGDGRKVLFQGVRGVKKWIRRRPGP